MPFIRHVVYHEFPHHCPVQIAPPFQDKRDEGLILCRPGRAVWIGEKIAPEYLDAEEPYVDPGQLFSGTTVFKMHPQMAQKRDEVSFFSSLPVAIDLDETASSAVHVRSQRTSVMHGLFPIRGALTGKP